MDTTNTINCYCFNPVCKSSIFASKDYMAVHKSLSDVLTNTIYCSNCNSELISKPVLEIKGQINRCLRRRLPLKAIVINKDPFFHTSTKALLKDISDFEKILHCTNGKDALQYLEKNKYNEEMLPDLIFIDGTANINGVVNFLNGYKNIYPNARKKSSVFITTEVSSKEEFLAVSDYNFLKGTIFKPLKKDTLKDITAVLDTP